MFSFNKVNSYDDLPNKYKHVIDLYLQDNNMTNSFKSIYSEDDLKKLKYDNIAKRATKFFNRDCIKSIIKERSAKCSEMTEEEVRNFIHNNLIAIAKGEVEDQFSKKTSVKDRLEANKQLSKLFGLDVQKIDLNANVTTILVDDIEE